MRVLTGRDAQVLKAVAELIGDCPTCTLVTVDENGLPVARQMSDNNTGHESSLWLHTSVRTRKVAHLRVNPNAGLNYFNYQDLKSVYVTATCAFISDPRLRAEHFRKSLLRYFPAGPEDPAYVLLEFTPTSFVYYPGPEAGHSPYIWVPDSGVRVLNID